MNTTTKATHSTEKRDAPPVLLKLTPSDRQRAEEFARKSHLPLSTWMYTIFKEAINKEDDNERQN